VTTSGFVGLVNFTLREKNPRQLISALGADTLGGALLEPRQKLAALMSSFLFRTDGQVLSQSRGSWFALKTLKSRDSNAFYVVVALEKGNQSLS
jgi:hypothetical protein